MNVMSDLSVFFPPSLAWEFYNSLRRKSVASFKDSQVRNSTPLPPSPPCLLCRPTLHCSLACRLQHECCMLLQPSPTPFPCNHFGALLFFGVCVCVCAFPLHDLTWTAWFWFESFLFLQLPFFPHPSFPCAFLYEIRCFFAFPVVILLFCVCLEASYWSALP